MVTPDIASSSVAQLPLRTRNGTIVGWTLVDAVDYATLAQYSWRLSNTGHALRKIRLPNGRYYSMYLHREVLGLMQGERREVDHINRDALDNRRSNLRVATHALNTQNKGIRKGATSRYRGVAWFPASGKWRARVKVNYHSHHVGLFDSEEAAGEAIAAFRAAHMPFSEEASLQESA